MMDFLWKVLQALPVCKSLRILWPLWSSIIRLSKCLILPLLGCTTSCLLHKPPKRPAFTQPSDWDSVVCKSCEHIVLDVQVRKGAVSGRRCTKTLTKTGNSSREFHFACTRMAKAGQVANTEIATNWVKQTLFWPPVSYSLERALHFEKVSPNESYFCQMPLSIKVYIDISHWNKYEPGWKTERDCCCKTPLSDQGDSISCVW